MRVFLTTLVIAAALAAVGCGKQGDAPSEGATPATQAPAADAPAAAPATPAASPTTPPAAAAAEDPEMAAKRAAVEFALMEDGYKSDPQGQWAVSATASSTYSSSPSDPSSSYHPMQATGIPNTPDYGDRASAWAAQSADQGIEWLEVSFARAVSAAEIRIRQNYGPGAIIKVEMFDEAGKAHTVWQGPDETKYAESKIVWLNTKFEPTPYKTQRAKITLATNAVSGWNEIDAVQLVGQ